MEEKINLWMKLTKSPKLLNKEKDLWFFYCQFCYRWEKGTRHGYTSEFWSQMYFECDNGHKIEAPGWWK